MIDAHYYVDRSYLGAPIVGLPRVRLEFTEDYSAAKLWIENNVKYVQRLNDVQLSSALKNYVVERQYLTKVQNEYCFELYDSAIERQQAFTTTAAFLANCRELPDDVLYVDQVTSLRLFHLLIVGQTGSGKTYALYSLLLQVINKPVHYHLYLADPKASSLAILGDIISPQHSASDVDDIISQLHDFNDKMQARKAELHQQLKSKLDASYSDFGLEPYLFVFDEYAAFKSIMQSRDKKSRDEAESLIAQVILQGRQLGFFMWFVLQKSDATILPTVIRDNLPWKIVLGNAEQQTYVTTFGNGTMIPNRNYGLGEGVYTYAGIANTPKLCAFSTLKFDILDAFKRSVGSVITHAPQQSGEHNDG
ncbi:FtsK/SpoIIIE domain-containing protein [Lacticaseibacillus saniviri]